MLLDEKFAEGQAGGNPIPTEEEIRVAISGGICRCTGYQNIVAAVQWAAEQEAVIKQEV